MRRAAKRDGNHAAVRDYLRRLGWSVLDLGSHGRGIPDLLAGCPGFACLVEVKNLDGKGDKLSPDEQRVYDLWTGPYVKTTSPEDAAEQLLALKRGWHERNDQA